MGCKSGPARTRPASGDLVFPEPCRGQSFERVSRQAHAIGKISEVAVREAIHGRPIGNDTALANPECLAAYMALPELAEAV